MEKTYSFTSNQLFKLVEFIRIHPDLHFNADNGRLSAEDHEDWFMIFKEVNKNRLEASLMDINLHYRPGHVHLLNFKVRLDKEHFDQLKQDLPWQSHDFPYTCYLEKKVAK